MNYELLMPNELNVGENYYLNHVGRFYLVVGGTRTAIPIGAGMTFTLLEDIEYPFASEKDYLSMIKSELKAESELKLEEEKKKESGELQTGENFSAVPLEGLSIQEKEIAKEKEHKAQLLSALKKQ